MAVILPLAKRAVERGDLVILTKLRTERQFNKLVSTSIAVRRDPAGFCCPRRSILSRSAIALRSLGLSSCNHYR